MRKQITYVLVTVLFTFGSIFSTQANFVEYDDGGKVVIVVIDKMGNETSVEFEIPKVFIGQDGKLLAPATVSIFTLAGKDSYVLDSSNGSNIITGVQALNKDTEVVLEVGNYRARKAY